MSYSAKRLSNYEGFRRLDVMQAKVATGKLRPPREPVTDYLCEVCQRRKRSRYVVPSLTAGERVKPFVGRFVLACAECKAALERAGVPQAASAQASRLAALGLVAP